MKNRVVFLAVFVFVGLGFISALSFSVVKARQNTKLQIEVTHLQSDVSELGAQVTRLIEQRPVTRTVDFDALALSEPDTVSSGTVSVEVHAGELERLHAALADRDARLEQLKAELAAAGEAPREPSPRSQTSFTVRMRERMEQLKQENPEAYETLQKERQVRRVQLADATRERADFFKNIEVEGMPEEYVETHNALVAKLEYFDDAMARIMADPDSEETHTLRHEMFSNWREVSGLMESERNVLLDDFARQLGYNKDESTRFVEYIDYVNEMTTIRLPHMGGDRGRGRDDSRSPESAGN